MKYATLDRVVWCTHRPLLRPIADIPLAEKDLAYYRQGSETAIAVQLERNALWGNRGN